MYTFDQTPRINNYYNGRNSFYLWKWSKHICLLNFLSQIVTDIENTHIIYGSILKTVKQMPGPLTELSYDSHFSRYINHI